MKQYSKEEIKNQIKQNHLLCDGAFGTYYALKYDTKELPEFANKLHPERVVEIHKEYIAAGARLLRANTYASNTVMLQNAWEEVEENLRSGYRLAKQAVENMAKDNVETAGDNVETCRESVFVAADIGQIPNENPAAKETVVQEYIDICRVFLEEGAEVFVFETFADIEDIRPAIEFIGNKAFIIVQFAINQFGYSNLGLSARKLIGKAESIEWIDAVGFNCGVGPAHMQQIIRGLKMPINKPLTAFPNAGYPQNVSNRMIFSNENINYFVAKTGDLAEDGVTILGGCCGTTPEYISRMNVLLEEKKKKWEQENNEAGETEVANAENVRDGNVREDDAGRTEGADGKEQRTIINHSFFAGKTGKKLIAVELAPPLGSDDEKLMDAAHLLLKSGVDVLTFPDSPSGRTRADSILMAEKVARETGMCVMPHLCCRDKNAIAMRSQLLGAHINGIHNFLIVTGDPIPMMVRSSVKSVFNFDSVGLMQIANDMNEEQFADAPICFGGAINQTRRNLDVEIGRVKKKMAAGATFFLTQPVSTKQGVERLRRVKEETGARILCGIMPFVSLKNATFMKNEMTGIEVTEEVLARYREDMTREEGEQAGIQLAKEIIALTEDFVDGYYFSFPFNRVVMLQQILEKN